MRSPRRRSTMPAPKARTSRWAPPMLTREHLLEVLRAGLERRPRLDLGRVGHEDLHRPEGRLRLLGEAVHRGRIGQVEVAGHRLSPLGADGRRHLVADLDPARAEHDGVARPGQRPCRLGPDARGGAGHRRRPAFGVRLEARHQRGVTVVGSAAKPRTLMECTRAHARRVDLVGLDQRSPARSARPVPPCGPAPPPCRSGARCRS